MSLAGHRAGQEFRSLWWGLSLLPYVVGALHFLLFNVLFWKVRGTFYGGDSGEYLQIANDLLSGTLLAEPKNGKPLGYPLLLALAESLPGSTVVNALIFNAFFYLSTIYMVGRIMCLLTCSPTVTRMTQTGFALVSNTAAWANLLLSETMTMALFVGGCWVYLRVASAPAQKLRIGHCMVLGVLLGALSVTRMEYVLLLPILTLLLGYRCLSRHSPLRNALINVAVLWVCSLPMLMIQPIVSGWKGPASLIPPRQSAFLEIWRSWYDLEFTQLRWHKLREIVLIPEEDTSVAQAKVMALKYNDTNEAPIDDSLLNQAYGDIQRLRDLSIVQGVPILDAYRQVGLERLRQDPWRYASRAVQRLFLYITAADLDWSHSHRAHWMYTMLLRPLSTLAYLLLIILLVVNRVYPRGIMFDVGLWMVFPILVHSVFIFDQRFIYPSIPLLCVVWGQAIQNLLGLRATQGCSGFAAPPEKQHLRQPISW